MSATKRTVVAIASLSFQLQCERSSTLSAVMKKRSTIKKSKAAKKTSKKKARQHYNLKTVEYGEYVKIFVFIYDC